VLHTICVFANDFHSLGAGYFVIGVEEANGRPVLPPKSIDPESVESMQKELLRLGHQAIQPAFHALSAPYTVNGRTVFVVWAPGGKTRPYKCRVSLGQDAKEWAWYIRRGSSTVRAQGADERVLLGLAATVPFDDRSNTSASIEDLSRRLIGEFLDEVGSELASEAPSLPMNALGRQMNVVGGSSEAPFPKNVACSSSTTSRTASFQPHRSTSCTSLMALAATASKRRYSRGRSGRSHATRSTTLRAAT